MHGETQPRQETGLVTVGAVQAAGVQGLGPWAQHVGLCPGDSVMGNQPLIFDRQVHLKDFSDETHLLLLFVVGQWLVYPSRWKIICFEYVFLSDCLANRLSNA